MLILYNFRLELDLKIVVVPVAEEDEVGGDVAELETPDFLRSAPLITLRACAREPEDVLVIFVLGFCLQSEQSQVSGMAVLLTLAQVRCTQVRQELHSIIGRPP